jgi:hypothetical protein
MRLFARGLLSVALGLSNLTCSVNILENFADKKTNMAYYYDAQKMINDGNYQGAIDKLNLIIGEFSTDRKVVGLKASAYGGLCGINFISFVTSMTNMGSTRIFPFLMGAFSSATEAQISSCIIAQDLMVSIGSSIQRTSDENMFLLVVAFAKIGKVLAFYADADNNGTLDAAYTAVQTCDKTNLTRTAGLGLTNSDTIEVGTGLALAIEQLNALSGVVNLGNGTLTTIQGLCTSLPVNFCAMTTTASWSDGSNDALEVAAVRTLLNESSAVGLGTCTGDYTACACIP